MIHDREFELEEKYENTILLGAPAGLTEYEGEVPNFWQPTEASCPTLLIKEISGFAALDYRLLAVHYKTLFDFLDGVKKLVDEARAKNALQTRFAILVHGLSDRIRQTEIELGVSIMRALEVARFIERTLPRYDLHRAEPPKSRADTTPPPSIDEIAMFISAAGNSELLEGTHAGNRRVIISACSQEV
jgi:hypothetical protein